MMRATREENMGIFDANMRAIRKLVKMAKLEENLAMETKTHATSQLKEEMPMYGHPMTVKRKQQDSSAMDPRNTGRFETRNNVNDLKYAENRNA